MIKLPKSYTYAEAYLTLRCNLNCSYCINNVSDVKRKRKELNVEEWVGALNKINFGEVPLTLGGGEPTIHKGFFKILEKLNPNIKIDLLTNLQFDVDEFIDKVDVNRFNKIKNPAYRSIRASYHIESMDPNELVLKVKKLQDNGFSIGIFGLNHPKNLEENMQMSELTRKEQIYFFVKDFLGEYENNIFGHFRYPDAIKGKKKNCECKINEFLIAPDGDVYRCHRDLYHNENPTENILNPNFEIKDIFRSCNEYGGCNPCDVKEKANRFLKAGNCSVEIKNIKY